MEIEDWDWRKPKQPKPYGSLFNACTDDQHREQMYCAAQSRRSSSSRQFDNLEWNFLCGVSAFVGVCVRERVCGMWCALKWIEMNYITFIYKLDNGYSKVCVCECVRDCMRSSRHSVCTAKIPTKSPTNWTAESVYFRRIKFDPNAVICLKSIYLLSQNQFHCLK